MLKAGSIIGEKYRLTRRVGAGANATVWAAEHETLKRPVAVKCIRAEVVASKEAVSQFLAEARIAASLRHRFIVDIFDFGTTEDGLPFMVMELLKGESLAERVAFGPPTPVRTFVGFMDMALVGLHTAHQAGVIHRDLKPENIFLARDDDGAVYPKLVDFGISLVHEPFSSSPRPGQEVAEGVVVGTPAYMSPEQIQRVEDLDRRTDLYSMGVILYEALTGQLPHRADSLPELLRKIGAEDVVPLAQLRPELGTALSDVVARAMARDRDDRFDDALQMRRALQAADVAERSLFTVVTPGSHRRTTSGAAGARAEGDEVATVPAPPRGLRSLGEALRHRRVLVAVLVTLLLGTITGVVTVAVQGPGVEAAARPDPVSVERAAELLGTSQPAPPATLGPAPEAPASSDAAPSDAAAIEAPAGEEAGPARPGTVAPRQRPRSKGAPSAFRDPGF
jgi:serine/threonine-protein kinase